MSKKRAVTGIIIVIILIPVVIIALALQNPPWANDPPFINIEMAISNFILSHFDVVDIPGGQSLNSVSNLTYPKLKLLEAGKIKVFTGIEIANKAYKRPIDTKNYFIVAIIEPDDVEGKAYKERRRVIQAVDDLAVKGKINAIVEATASDTARANSWGLKETERLRNAGVIRCVVFDGGHHIGTLPLEPDILLVPTIYYAGQPSASHWYTRDTVPLGKLQKVLNREKIGSVIARFPRDGLPVKNPSGMAGLARQAILDIAKKACPERNRRNVHNKTTATFRRRPIPLTNYGEIGIRETSLFISMDVDPYASKDAAISRIASEVKRREGRGKKIKHVYLGLTFGTSKFPFRSKKVDYSMDDLEKSLNKRLPCKVTIMSEPVSTWDIYLGRIGL